MEAGNASQNSNSSLPVSSNEQRTPSQGSLSLDNEHEMTFLMSSLVGNTTGNMGSSSSFSRPAQCSLCFSSIEEQSKIHVINQEKFARFSDLVVGTVPNEIKPFREISNEMTETNVPTPRDRQVMCSCCKQDFNVILHRQELLLSHEKVPRLSLEAALASEASFIRRRAKSLSLNAATESFSKRCFLQDKASQKCSYNGGRLLRTVQLAKQPATYKVRWASAFAKKAGVSKEHCLRIWDNPMESLLCERHTNSLKNALDVVKAADRSCSICCEFSNTRKKRRLVRFPWDKIREHPVVRCIVEDAVAEFTDNRLRASHIRFLCDSCRRVILRAVDMQKMEPQSFAMSTKPRSRTTFLSDRGFFHGRSPNSVRMTISFIREKLWSVDVKKSTSFVVFMQDVRKFYEDAARSIGEGNRIVRDDRTLKMYLCPSLAVTNIVSQQGSRKMGSYFCSLETFDEISQYAKEPKKGEFKFEPDELEVFYDDAEEVFRRNGRIMRSFSWSLAYFIRQMPRKLWYTLVHLSKPVYLRRRAKYNARLLNETFDTQWPFNPEEVPLETGALTVNELQLAVKIMKQIENTVLLRSNGKVAGPLTTAMSVVASGSAKKNFIDFLGRVGVLSSYQTIYSWRQDEINNRLACGPFTTLALGAFVVVGIDNINIRSRNQLAVHGQSYDGFDGVAVQAINPNQDFNFSEYCRGRPLHERVPLAMDISDPVANRHTFVEENFPQHDDPDIMSFRYLTCGLALTHREQLTSENSQNQRSFRSIVLDSLTGFPVGKSRVEYIDITRSKLTEVEIVEKLEQIELYYNPPEQRRNPEDYVFVAVHGDQPVFKLLFKQWYRSYIQWLQKGAKLEVSHSDNNLFRWLVPLPGGFHVDMQGLIPLIKEYLSGSGMEELLQFAGLSAGLQKVFLKFNQYRTNRRFLVQVLVAMILRLGESLSCMSLDFANQLEEYRRLVTEDNSAGEESLDHAERRKSQKEILPDGATLSLLPTVHPAVLRAGKLFVNEVLQRANSYPNMAFYGRVQLLELLVPWLAYNTLARKAQTNILDKFYFVHVGLMHRSRKINYMENMLFYAVIRKVMPRVVAHVLYKRRHLVVNINRNAAASDSHFHLDESQEALIIRDTKRMCVNDERVLTNLVPWIMLLGVAHTTLSISLGLCTAVKRSEDSIETDAMGTSVRLYDKEKKQLVTSLSCCNFVRQSYGLLRNTCALKGSKMSSWILHRW